MQEPLSSRLREIKDNEDAMEDLEKEVKDNNSTWKKWCDRLKEAGQTAKSIGSGLAKVGSVVAGVGKTAAIGFTALAVAATAIGTTVVSKFGELEQNLGGSEAVFGEYASKIQAIGEDAYRTMGTSQSEYLATANKMGALFQGSGLAQERSLDLTTKAMQRATDMASVMGVETSAALEAVTGAAKGNYTMMDNLGVAMNATTLQAYATAQGIETAFAKMTNAEKAELAMAYFFEQTEQYAGNFEREATETVSGSLGLLSAAFDSFVAGLGNADANMQNLTDNVGEAFAVVVDNIAPVLGNVAKSLPTVLNSLMSTLVSELPDIFSIGGEMIAELGAGIGVMLPKLIVFAGDIIEQLCTGLLNRESLQQIMLAATDLIIRLVEMLEDNAESITMAAVTMVETLAVGLGDSLPELIPAIIRICLTIVDVLMENLDIIIEAGIQLAIGLISGILMALPDLLSGVVSALGKGLESVFSLGNKSFSFSATGIDASSIYGGEEDLRVMRTAHSSTTVEHTGTIRHEGVNDEGEFIDSVDAVMERIKDESRT